ncbi:hypothetical protein BD289DRAFT_124784 [Coniella lustricola]|uniref:Uncharacterized protein n=1 Tax=Coniella lustricola TaxID=2025994 RepID=A0A2T3AFT0_9PEZI|nr:hypothetical protein BD289DRAFT_124784 [Coniella lustricola]
MAADCLTGWFCNKTCQCKTVCGSRKSLLGRLSCQGHRDIPVCSRLCTAPVVEGEQSNTSHFWDLSYSLVAGSVRHPISTSRSSPVSRWRIVSLSSMRHAWVACCCQGWRPTWLAASAMTDKSFGGIWRTFPGTCCCLRGSRAVECNLRNGG